MTQSKESMQIQVGAFAAIGLLLLMMVIFMLGNEKKLFEKQYTLVARFDDISGLRAGAPVQLAGIHVGTVSEILFDQKIERRKVKLLLQVDEDYKERIREDTSATIVTQGLLGDKMVFLTVGTPEKRELVDGDEITALSPSGFYQLMERGDEAVANVNEVAKKVDAILHEVQQGKGVLHALIYDPSGEKLVRQLADLGDNLEEASVDMASITKKIDEGNGTIGALINDPTLFNDMKTLLGKANRNKLIRAVIRETLRGKEEASIHQ